MSKIVTAPYSIFAKSLIIMHGMNHAFDEANPALNISGSMRDSPRWLDFGLSRSFLTKEKIMLKRSPLRLLASVTFLCLSLTAEALVVQGTSSAFGESVNLTTTLPIGGPIVVTSGPLPTVSGTAPAPFNINDNLASVNVVPVLSTGVLDVNAASNVDGSAGSKFASADATVNNLSVLLALIGLDLTATSIQSTANVSGDFGALTQVGTTTLEGLILNGTPFLTAMPSANFVLLSLLGLTVTLNEQILTGDNISSAGIEVNAIHISFDNFVDLTSLTSLSGDIIISNSQAALLALANGNGQAVPEPGTLLLLAGGLLGLMVMKRRSFKI